MSALAAQAELPCAITKDADGQIQNRSYRYLTLDKLIEQTRPILTKHGLVLTQHPTMVERCDTFVPGLVGNDATVEAEYER